MEIIAFIRFLNLIFTPARGLVPRIQFLLLNFIFSTNKNNFSTSNLYLLDYIFFLADISKLNFKIIQCLQYFRMMIITTILMVKNLFISELKIKLHFK